MKKVIVIESILIFVMVVVIFMVASELNSLGNDVGKCQEAFNHQRGILQGVLNRAETEHMKHRVCAEQLKACNEEWF